jgi:hypothetical protein
MFKVYLVLLKPLACFLSYPTFFTADEIPSFTSNAINNRRTVSNRGCEPDFSVLYKLSLPNPAFAATFAMPSRLCGAGVQLIHVRLR